VDPTHEMPTLDHLAELSVLARGEPQVYLRYSPGPLSDTTHPSTDHESGLVMPGLSVNPLRPPAWWSLPEEDWVARRVCQYLRELQEGARPWVLTGEVIDHGPDNEPLLIRARPIAWLSPSLLREAHQRYHDRWQQDARPQPGMSGRKHRSWGSGTGSVGDDACWIRCRARVVAVHW
jgi:hypothetical protein